MKVETITRDTFTTSGMMLFRPHSGGQVVFKIPYVKAWEYASGDLCKEVYEYFRVEFGSLACYITISEYLPKVIWWKNDYSELTDLYCHPESWKQFLMEHPDLLSAQTLFEMQK